MCMLPFARCYHRPTLDSFARHFETGEPLPEDLYEKLVAAKNFRWDPAPSVPVPSSDCKLAGRAQACTHHPMSSTWHILY